jgi:hypothetical protein
VKVVKVVKVPKVVKVVKRNSTPSGTRSAAHRRMEVAMYANNLIPQLPKVVNPSKAE